MNYATFGIVIALFFCAGSLLFGTISENDFHRLNNSVDNAFFAPSPGKMFEVARNSRQVTPLCTYANVEDAVLRDDTQYKRYTNTLGRNVPVAKVMAVFMSEMILDPVYQIEIAFYAEGLKLNYAGGPDASCETRAQIAIESRNSIVCVVDNVLRLPGSDEIVGVRFKPFGFAPSGSDSFPVCPLEPPADTWWKIRRQLISVQVLPRAQAEANL